MNEELAKKIKKKAVRTRWNQVECYRLQINIRKKKNK